VEIIAELEQHGLLLKTDSKLPNVCALVAGEAIRGSWWAHPRSHEIFHALADLAKNENVLVAKLVSGKDTFIHRSLWPAVVAVGSAREPWQTSRLDKESRALLAKVDKNGQVQASGKSALILEKALLVHGEQIHTEAGSHAKTLTSWLIWAQGNCVAKMPVAAAKASLEKLVDHLNRRCGARGNLPWRSE
jgi:hypothetical protein